MIRPCLGPCVLPQPIPRAFDIGRQRVPFEVVVGVNVSAPFRDGPCPLAALADRVNGRSHTVTHGVGHSSQPGVESQGRMLRPQLRHQSRSTFKESSYSSPSSSRAALGRSASKSCGSFATASQALRGVSELMSGSKPRAFEEEATLPHSGVNAVEELSAAAHRFAGPSSAALAA